MSSNGDWRDFRWGPQFGEGGGGIGVGCLCWPLFPGSGTVPRERIPHPEHDQRYVNHLDKDAGPQWPHSGPSMRSGSQLAPSHCRLSHPQQISIGTATGQPSLSQSSFLPAQLRRMGGGSCVRPTVLTARLCGRKECRLRSTYHQSRGQWDDCFLIHLFYRHFKSSYDSRIARKHHTYQQWMHKRQSKCLLTIFLRDKNAYFRQFLQTLTEMHKTVRLHGESHLKIKAAARSFNTWSNHMERAT